MNYLSNRIVCGMIYYTYYYEENPHYRNGENQMPQCIIPLRKGKFDNWICLNVATNEEFIQFEMNIINFYKQAYERNE